MPDPVQDLDRLALSVQRLRLALLGLVGVAALLVFGSAERPPSGSFTKSDALWSALALAAGAIFTRQTAISPKRPPRARLRGLIVSYLLSGALGIVGVATALLAGERMQGLGFLAAAGLFVLGAPQVGRAREGAPR